MVNTSSSGEVLNPGVHIEAAFIINLVQDLNILRPLAILAKRDFGFAVKFLVASKFTSRDVSGIWAQELALLVSETGAHTFVFEYEHEALGVLTNHGLLFAASESNLPGHSVPHEVFRISPPSYLRVTLQHGFECVGFRHSVAHIHAHGPHASFAADIVCAWFDTKYLNATARSQSAKVRVTGPAAVLQQYRDPIERSADSPGLVCENLHSVRMNALGDLKAEFVDVFGAFCSAIISSNGGRVALRPHPGGQYTVRNQVTLPSNVALENAPIYRTDLRKFAFGISAPSSVLLDMVLAGIPTAVWRDGEGRLDTDNYSDLPSVSTVSDWVAFAAAARVEPEQFTSANQAFLRRFGVLTDPQEVYASYASIFAEARKTAGLLSLAAKRAGVRMGR